MDKYRCVGCGYIYDPVKGDPENGQPPGTAFEDLPDLPSGGDLPGVM